jgi:hypothetical protein
MQPAIIAILKAAGIDHYDFRNPPGKTGFGWKEVGVVGGGETHAGYLARLRHPRVREGFYSDFEAMKKADACVLVLPCERSAHLELGWMAGAGKRTAILLDEEPIRPELMYLLADFIAATVDELLEWLEVEN